MSMLPLHGYSPAIEAIEALGRELFGKDWNGRESMMARRPRMRVDFDIWGKDADAAARWHETVARLHKQLGDGAKLAMVLHRAAPVVQKPLSRTNWLEAGAADRLARGAWPIHRRDDGEILIAIAKPEPDQGADWLPGKEGLREWANSPAAEREAVRRAQGAVSANPSDRDVCRALARMWVEAGQPAVTWGTIEQYRTARRKAEFR